MAKPDDTVSWREFSDQLTAEQVAKLERLEGSPAESLRFFLIPARRPGGRPADADEQRRIIAPRLLSTAQRWAQENRLADKEGRLNRLCPAPPDATHADPWDKGRQENDVWYRWFDSRRKWEVVDEGLLIATVSVGGRQFEDGRCERRITLNVAEFDWRYTGLSPAQTRKVATALREAADHVHMFSQ